MFLQHYNTFIQALNLPAAKLCFHEHIDPDDIRNTFQAFTRPHPRFRFIRAKTIGAALIDHAAHPSVREELWEEAQALGLA